jgi:threonine/homoserine efflux transporter RhtA
MSLEPAVAAVAVLHQRLAALGVPAVPLVVAAKAKRR